MSQIPNVMSNEDQQPVLLFPMFLNLTNQQVTVIGGGAVAERKVLSMLDYQAVVKLVSPDLTDALSLMVESGIITHVNRTYESGDLEGSSLAIAATGDYATNMNISVEASRLHIPVNFADDPTLCTFMNGAVVNRDPFQIAISTSGNAPMLAQALKEQFEEEFPKEYAFYVELLGEIREIMKLQIPDSAERKARFKELLKSDLQKEILNGSLISAQEAYDMYVADGADK